ncbi:MAG: class I SAM-dependent DNA methyltransferase, partial [Pseudomonadaceae bacterium]|nr:class I SAM-dependent DNA methyltransferase [Pseudomonadaceae bacterium]
LAVKTDGDQSSKRIDLLWPGTLLVEMKSAGKNLDEAFQQAVDYLKRLSDQDKPVYILVCDLQNFRLHNVETSEEHNFPLAELPDNLDLFGFMHGKDMQQISEFELNEKAALLLGDLYDSLRDSGFEGHALQVFMVRILFCLFAEDTGVFNPRQLVLYLLNFTREDGSDTEMHLQKIFQTLDTPPSKRSKALSEEQADFPYVNGQLFKERIDMPSFTAEMREMLISCCLFNWKEISPAIFGSLFQSIMNKETRRNLGAHYTSEQNILKVIEPLFLDDLKADLDQILELKVKNTRNKRLMEFVGKLRNLKFLDPACGCGNFLIVTYRELRRLELKVFEAQHGGSAALALEIQPQVPLDNFYGIEIDEWPARIAEVAMWLTQHQMNVEFAKTFGKEPDLLPLKEHANIHHANALTLDWQDVIQPKDLSYIIGNPPFIGHQWRSKEQQQDMTYVFPKTGNFGKLDFVAAWFYKAALFSQKTTTEIGFVATNSICMGEQTGVLWQPLLDMGVYINFAHRTFAWTNDAKGKAAVHCIVVGYAYHEKERKLLFDYPNIKGSATSVIAKNINPYLIDAPSVVLPSRSKPFKGVPAMTKGSQPTDGGNIILDAEERKKLLQLYPELEVWIKPFIGGREWINNLKRYCFWFAEATPKQLAELSKNPEIKQRIEAVKVARLKSPTASVREYAKQPFIFTQNRQPNSNFIAVPEVSSERRAYIPMGFLTKETIPSNQIYMIPGLGRYEFGVLVSQMHMDWMRVVAGRLKSDYRYSPNVYQLFPWPEVTDKQKQQIEKLAQAVLDARQAEFDKDPETSLADLYDPNFMPPTLRKAHSSLDKAVDKLYQAKAFNSPMERVQCLFQRYAEATGMAEA